MSLTSVEMECECSMDKLWQILCKAFPWQRESEDANRRVPRAHQNWYSLSAPNLEPVMSPDFSTCRPWHMLLQDCTVQSLTSS